VLDVGMEVHVVVAEVGETRKVELEQLGAAQCQRVAGHFHHHVGEAVCDHGIEQPLQVGAFGGGVGGRNELGLVQAGIPVRVGCKPAKWRRNPVTHGSHQARRHSCKVQEVQEEARCGGLALRAGEPHCEEFARRIIV